jgi:hypothetical protein
MGFHFPTRISNTVSNLQSDGDTINSRDRPFVLSRDIDSLRQYEPLAPHAAKAVPLTEHFVPLLIAVGSGTPGRDVRVLFDAIEYGYSVFTFSKQSFYVLYFL